MFCPSGNVAAPAPSNVVIGVTSKLIERYVFSGCSSNTTAVDGLIGTVCTLSKINLALALTPIEEPASIGDDNPPVLTDSSLVWFENDSFQTVPFSPINGFPPNSVKNTLPDLAVYDPPQPVPFTDVVNAESLYSSTYRLSLLVPPVVVLTLA